MDTQAKALKIGLNTILLSSILILGFSFIPKAQATANQQQNQYQGQQINLAYNGYYHDRRGRYGRHGGYYGGWGIYVAPRYNRRGGTYWTGWRSYYRHGHRCVRNCLVSRYNGQIIRCQRRCY